MASERRTKKVRAPDGTDAEGLVVMPISSQETWNTHLLDDGSTLRVKNVVLEIVRVIGHYNSAGDPIYLVRSQNLVVSDVPPELKKPRA